MAISYLMNNVTSGESTYNAGDSFTVGSVEALKAIAAGGVMVASTVSGMAEAAAICMGIHLRGDDPAHREQIMTAAHLKALQAEVTALIGLTSYNTISTDGTRRTATFQKSLVAAGTTVHATDAGGAPLALVAGFTNPMPRRTLNIARSDAGPANVTYTVTIETPDGGSVDLPLIVAKNANASTTIAGKVTGISTTVDPVSTSAFTTGTGFNLGALFTGTPLLGVNGVAEALASSDSSSGTIVPTTAPDGAKEFVVQFTEPHGHTLSLI